jgi:hypothetical protein
MLVDGWGFCLAFPGAGWSWSKSREGVVLPLPQLSAACHWSAPSKRETVLFFQVKIPIYILHRHYSYFSCLISSSDKGYQVLLLDASLVSRMQL